MSITYRLLGVPLIASFVCGCAIHLYSDYDADMDKGITQVQEGVNQQIAKIRECALADTRAKGVMPKKPEQIICQHPNATYSAADYTKIQIQLDSLIVRSEAVPHNRLTTENLINIEHAILQFPQPYLEDASAAAPASMPGASDQKARQRMSIQERHQIDSPISLWELRTLTNESNTAIRSILTVELAKKSGNKKAD